MKCPPIHWSKGPVIINGKTTPKGKSTVKNPTKGPIKSPTTQSQANSKKSLSSANVQTPTLVQLLVTSSPTVANSRPRHAVSQMSQPAKSINPNSLAVMITEMKYVAPANSTIKPALDKVELHFNVGLL